MTWIFIGAAIAVGMIAAPAIIMAAIGVLGFAITTAIIGLFLLLACGTIVAATGLPLWVAFAIVIGVCIAIKHRKEIKSFLDS